MLPTPGSAAPGSSVRRRGDRRSPWRWRVPHRLSGRRGAVRVRLPPSAGLAERALASGARRQLHWELVATAGLTQLAIVYGILRRRVAEELARQVSRRSHTLPPRHEGNPSQPRAASESKHGEHFGIE